MVENDTFGIIKQKYCRRVIFGVFDPHNAQLSVAAWLFLKIYY